MKCPNCNHENFEGASFCTECGHTLSSNATCPNCGAKDLTPNTRFCPHCGHSMVSRPEPEPISIPEPPISPRIIEIKCGFVVTGSDFRPGILTIDTNAISFKSKGFISAFMGKVNFTLPIANITGIIRSDRYVTFVDDDDTRYPLSNQGVFADNDIVDNIAYAVELYRRMFWMYGAGKYPNYPMLDTYRDIKLNLNNISTEQLIARVKRL